MEAAASAPHPCLEVGGMAAVMAAVVMAVDMAVGMDAEAEWAFRLSSRFLDLAEEASLAF